MKVIKFGGSSVSTASRIKNVVDIIKPYVSEGVVVVVSAMGGVTDQLISLSQWALKADPRYKEHLAELENKHLTAVKELVKVQNQSSVLAQVKFMFNELEDVLHGVFLVKERTARTLDYIMSFGERLSAFIISEACKEADIDAEFLDARNWIRTNQKFGNAEVDFTLTNDTIKNHLDKSRKVAVVTGFIAQSNSGETTTLGRSGSDYTAAIVAGAIQADALEIWTDVDGMMTADPRLVRKAFTVPQVSYEEAMELSHFGAKVIFPATMRPAMQSSIPIWIKNTFNPSFSGTLIHKETVNGRVVKGISSISGISLLSVQGSGLLGVVGASSRLFSVLAKEAINVVLISQASSEHSICFAVEGGNANLAKKSLEKEFRYEIQQLALDPIQIETDLSIVAAVGDGMKHSPGSSGRMFQALGKNGINIMAIAQGSSERNISVVIRQVEVAKALNALHEAFFLSDRKVLSLFLLGTGLIGHTLIKMMDEQTKKLAKDNLLEIQLVGLANSKTMLINEDGISLKNWKKEMQDHGKVMSSTQFLESMVNLNLPNSIFVDCTASEELTEIYQEVLDSNISIVTPNKKANSGTMEKYHQLKTTAFKRGVKFLYETNVGAGLPVINTLNDLLLSGDQIIKVEAVLSGTLNYIFSSFTEGKKFSEVVKEAKKLGYTEPDPRDDLNGMDVARKILILSREAGYNFEMEDIVVENLVPEPCRGQMSIDVFFEKLEKFDPYFDELRNKASKEGKKLRYMAVLDQGKVKIQLGNVDDQHPFYSLSGSDNIILFTTERYHDRPMVIRGPGAGATVTAAGVFADVIRIGHYSLTLK